MPSRLPRRRTKILATINPDNITEAKLESLLQAGMDGTRHNLSHGRVEDHIRVITMVQALRSPIQPVSIVVDLQGPKLRILDFKDGKSIKLKANQQFILDASCGDNEGTEERVGLDYKNLIHDVKPGDVLALADGLLTLVVTEVKDPEIICRVETDGVLGGRKGLNKIGGGLSAPALTEKDQEDIAAVVGVRPDYFALSFVKDADDIRAMRAYLKSIDCHAGIIAKIERREAINERSILEITQEADMIMIARGDLGVEVGDAHLPGYQKQFIRLARSMNRGVITATQMMESMTTNPIPTRAEVFDVANAVLDGTDVVMLSGETAVGRYPVKVVSTMANIVLGAEEEKSSRVSHHRLETRFRHVEETVAMCAMYAANHHSEGDTQEPTIRAIVCLTETGQTCVYMSRISSGVSIYALSPNINTVNKLALYRGVYPAYFETEQVDHTLIVMDVMKFLRKNFPLQFAPGDRVLFTKGSKMRRQGGTNMMEIVTME